MNKLVWKDVSRLNCGDIMKLLITIIVVIVASVGTIFGIQAITDLINKVQKAKAKKEEIEKSYKIYLSNEYGYRIWHPIDSIACKLAFSKDRTQRIVDMPRLTFERWFTFYNLNPENWFIQTTTDVYSSNYSDIPYYAKLNEDKKWIVLPIFWSSPEEMGKFRDWLENEYQCGDARIYQQKQEENYKRLVEIVENDIKEKQDKVQQDLLKMRKELLTIDKEKPKKRPTIKLQLSNGDTCEVDKQDYEWYQMHQDDYKLYYNGISLEPGQYLITEVEK